MTIIALTCPSCGAPVLPSSAAGVVSCAYCNGALTGVPDASWDALLRGADDGDDDRPGARASCRVSGRKFFLSGRLGKGARCDVFLAARARQPTELVVIKALRNEGDRDALSSEWKLVSRLAESDVRGAPFMTTLLPQPVITGSLTSHSIDAPTALVYRWRSGYLHTLRDVRVAYPGGVDARTAVWMWRRLLDLIGWLQMNGVQHGAVLPEHVLVHPRDHGVVLVGWSHARAIEARKTGDIQESARSILYALGGEGDAPPAHVPEGIGALLSKVATRGETDAHALSTEVLHAATAAFGPPTYHPFTMPGWR